MNLFEWADVRSASRMHSVADARLSARRRLPAVVFDYVEGGADDEVTMRRNEEAFAAATLRPQMATGHLDPSVDVKVMGQRLALPVILGPCGLVRLLHPDGPAGAARAAARRGTVSVLSTVSGSRLEEVVGGMARGDTLEEVGLRGSGLPLWFQLYAAGGRPDADRLCDRAAAAGVEVLVVTVDTPTLGNRERDVRHGVAPPLRVDAHNAVPLGAQVFSRPVWAAQLAATGLRMGRRSGAGGRARGAARVLTTPVGEGSTAQGDGMLQAVASPFTWDDVAYLRDRWQGRLVVKGVLTGDDAGRAADAGADAVVVSNHGGRQLDGAAATLAVLPEVVGALRGLDRSVDVLVDGGIRRGAHVVKALALGAQAVLVGRPYLYGLAAAGERGVERVLDVLAEEMRRTMILIGCPSVSELSPAWVEQGAASQD